MSLTSAIPMPDKVERVMRLSARLKKMIDEMDVGESGLFDLETARCVQARLSYFGKDSIRRKDGQQYRVWRRS